jgi:hypothetical protein
LKGEYPKNPFFLLSNNTVNDSLIEERERKNGEFALQMLTPLTKNPNHRGTPLLFPFSFSYTHIQQYPRQNTPSPETLRFRGLAVVRK